MKYHQIIFKTLYKRGTLSIPKSHIFFVLLVKLYMFATNLKRIINFHNAYFLFKVISYIFKETDGLTYHTGDRVNVLENKHFEWEGVENLAI